jgi:ABC-type cobalamin/Fe3+-siderophores transport system ATPase subunit
MITRQEFPYLQELVINDAYAVKNLRVPVFAPGQEFKHLVLTGRNGSGKTTVLRGLAEGLRYPGHLFSNANIIEAILSKPLVETDSLFGNNHLEMGVVSNGQKKPLNHNNIVNAFFQTRREVHVADVHSVVSEQMMESNAISVGQGGDLVSLFKQYLVNKKVFQVFDTMEGREDAVRHHEQFFVDLEKSFREIFKDLCLSLEFVRENFEFYLVHSDGRRITFNQLSAGFSAFLSILMDLLMRVDLLRKQANDYSYDPCGFVLIDEPETHLHLEMQYQILPLLTNLFPNLQFIVATHSPAVASSIKNATVFDLSTGQALGDTAAGSSFSELMQTHFGLENEYSNVADKILEEVTEISAMPDRAAALARLQRLLEEQGRYMSPVLRLDVQAHLLHLQREQAA